MGTFPLSLEPVLTIARLSGGEQAADYYLDRSAECEEPELARGPSEYYTADAEHGGRWVGQGAAAVGLSGPLGAEGGRSLRSLLAGCGPDGSQLVGPVWRADPRSQVSTRVMVLAVQALAAEQEVQPAALFDESRDADAFAAAQAAVARDARVPSRPRAALSAELAGRLCAAAGLDPHAVFAVAGGVGAPSGDVSAGASTGAGTDVFAAALARVGERVDVRRVGLDLTFSAPKSVSVLFGLGDERVAGQVRAAHRSAVEQTLTYLEALVARGARGHHSSGRDGAWMATDGLVAASFDHVASRANDPQLHTHVVVANLVHGRDGKWGAFDTREAYRQALTGGYVYQAVLRGELTRRLGLRWTPVRRGVAEIEGIPVGLRRLFATRRAQVEQHLEATGRTGLHASRFAALRTRNPKQHTPDLTLREHWAVRAQEAGFAVEDILAAAIPRPDLDRGDDRARSDTALLTPDAGERPTAGAGRLTQRMVASIASRVLGAHGVTKRISTFDRRDLLRAVCEALPAGTDVTVTELRALATRIVRDDRIVPLLGADAATTRAASVVRSASVGERRYSTVELLTTEQQAMATAEARGTDGLARVTDDAVEQTLTRSAGSGLSAEQAAAVRQVLTSGAGVEVLVGPAGSGKTAALAAARRAWQQAGVPVRGAAVAALAACTLEDGAGITSMSLTRLLSEIHRDGLHAALPDGGVLVVDEASMVSTRTLARLIELTQTAHTKLVLVGDPAQLPEIDAGGLFAGLAAHLPAARLSGNVRQREDWERAALVEVRDGDPLVALAAYHAHRRVHLAESTTDARTKVVDAFLDTRHPDARSDAAEESARPAPVRDVVMLTSTRADTRALNRLARERLTERGLLGEAGMQVRVRGRAMQFAVGDAVLATTNDYPRGLLNGTRGTVVQADDDHLTVRTQQHPADGSGEVVLPRAAIAAGLLEHGYAMTCHRAQGITVDIALLYASRALSREAGYVALSRGRERNEIYATWEALVPEVDHDMDGPRDPRPLRAERDELSDAALVQRFSTRAAQRLASARLSSAWPGSDRLATAGTDRERVRRSFAERLRPTPDQPSSLGHALGR